ncbi:hypothetical protein J4455_04705 [Candidatus Woesearchaeota archaeon]|nr:hypothetical protein [Candidatus Woesearchaeota archaeon]
MKIISEHKDLLLNRRRLVFEIEHLKQATPKKEEVKKLIIEKLKIPENLINIKFIKSNFGNGTSRVNVYAYDDEKTFNDIEVFRKKPKVKKDAKKAQTKK